MWHWARQRRQRAGRFAVAAFVVVAGALAVGPMSAARGQTTADVALQAAQGTVRVLDMGDSYSAGNGAGDYSGEPGCYRSGRNYAQDFAAILRSKPYSQPTTVTNVACSGAVTADFSSSQGGRPPQLSYVNSSYDVIFLTIGGNDIGFSNIVHYCLIRALRSGAACAPRLSYAEKLMSDGTIASRIGNVLKGIRARANPLAKIVLVGYPFMEGDAGYTLLDGKTQVKVGQRLHAIGVTGDAIEQSVVNKLNASTPDRPYTFVSVHNLYDGPPYHGLYANKSNPARWMVQPPTTSGHWTTLIKITWYHPNPTGWLEEAKLLAATASVPKHPLTGPVITPTTLPAGYIGRRYVALLSTADGRSGHWQVAGTLPAGLRLDGDDIAGTPTRRQNASFRVNFTDSYGDPATATITLDVRSRVSGTVAAFGNNGLGELGNGQANCMSYTPVQIPGLTDVTEVTSDDTAAYALTASGKVYAWGGDDDGQIGNGTVDGTSIGDPTPTLVTGLPKIVAISAGARDGYALDASGNVWAWGDGAFGELGMGASVIQLDRPAKISELAGVTQISAGSYTAYALKSDGSVWAWGEGTWGALGDGSDSDQATTPKKIPGLSAIKQIAAGENNDGYALDSAGRVWAWGGNYNGAIGNGTTTDALTPVQVKDLPAVTSISAGSAVAHAVTAGGTIYGWGYYGSVGTGQTADAHLPVVVDEYPGMTAVEGQTAMFGIMADGTLMTWGPPFAPPLNVVDPVTPHVVSGLSDVVAAASGGAGYAVRSDGTVWTWGSNYSSELGQGKTCASRVPVAVAGLSGVTSLAAAGGNAVVARTDGTVWSWGYPQDSAGPAASFTPEQVTGLTDVTAVAAAGSTGYALRSNGSVWAWGGGANGQLGDGATTGYATTAQQVKGLANVVAISAGADGGYALRSNGTVWAWGYGYNGQLGNGRRYTSGCYCSATPVEVRGISTAVQVAGGGLAGYALLNNGTVRAWGDNSGGVLGNGTTASSATPVMVSGIGTATAISGGMGAGYAILADGSGRAWGSNFADELGMGKDGQVWNNCLCYDAPVTIAGLSGATSVAGDIADIQDPGPSAILGGGVSAYAVSANGAGWSWGCDDTGQLGSDSYLALGPKAGRLTGLTGVVQVAGGQAAGFALVT